MSDVRSRSPGTGAWFVLNLLSVITPVIVLVLMSVAEPGFLVRTFIVLVGYSVLLLIAFTLYAVTVGTLVFHGTWPGPWELIEGIVLGLALLGAIGVGLSRYAALPMELQPDNIDSARGLGVLPYVYWFAIQLAILLGVLFYCSALKSWTLRQLDERADGLSEVLTQSQRREDVDTLRLGEQQQELTSKEKELQRCRQELEAMKSNRDQLQERVETQEKTIGALGQQLRAEKSENSRLNRELKAKV